MHQWEAVEPQHLFGPEEPDEHDDDPRQFEDEKDIQAAVANDVDAAIICVFSGPVFGCSNVL